MVGVGDNQPVLSTFPTELRRWRSARRLNPLELASDDGDLRLITMLTSFATAADLTLAELQLVAFLRADESTADVRRRCP